MLMEKITYHINPETGRANICRATVQGCRFARDGQAPEHYETKQAAQKAYEKQNDEKVLETASKTDNGSEQERLSKIQELAKLAHENGFSERMRKAEINLQAARNYRREKEREEWAKTYKKRKVSLFEKIEGLTKQIEELENDKKQVGKYIEVLSTRSYEAGQFLSTSEKIVSKSQDEDKRLAKLGVEDALLFERETYQDEYKRLLELRQVLRKRLRNPFNIGRQEDKSNLYAVKRRLIQVYAQTYNWRITEKQKQEWNEYWDSIQHLLDENER